MELLVTAQQMRECDRIAIRKLGIPGAVLMENSGRAVAVAVERHFGNIAGKSVFIFCGKGNNGGDGFVAGRHLVSGGANVFLFLVGSSTQVKGDAKINLSIVRNMAKMNQSLSVTFQELKSMKSLDRLEEPDVIVDALFGTGFSGGVKNPYEEIIEWMNNSKVPIVAVDIPSGLNSDNGRVENTAVKATITVTMGLKKTGLIVGKGPEHTGKIELERIGVPEKVFRLDVTTYLVSGDDVKRGLPKRPFDAHKHSVGKIFVLAGSPGLTGAAAMASEAAMRVGAGAVVLGTPKSVYQILAKKLTEVMVEPLDDNDNGTVSLRAYPTIEKHIQWSDVVLVGPGLSRDPETQQLLWKIFHETDKNLLIDADGLNALAAKVSILGKQKKREIIMMPHTGELSRLIGIHANQIEESRIEIARSTAKKFDATVILKGAPTVTATAKGEVFVNSTGNPGMATAGSGDVLAGIIAALWGQKLQALEAAFCGVYIHGLAGDLAKTILGERGFMATDILKKTTDAVSLIERGASPSESKY